MHTPERHPEGALLIPLCTSIPSYLRSVITEQFYQLNIPTMTKNYFSMKTDFGAQVTPQAI